MKTPKTAKICYYVAIYKDADSGYWSRFVDFPAYDQGDTIEDTVYQSTVFLQNIADEYERKNMKLPVPSDIETFKKKLDKSDGEVVCISPVFVYPPSPAVRIQITAKANQIAMIDEYARQHDFTRSEFMIHSALEACQQ